MTTTTYTITPGGARWSAQMNKAVKLGRQRLTWVEAEKVYRTTDADAAAQMRRLGATVTEETS